MNRDSFPGLYALVLSAMGAIPAGCTPSAGGNGNPATTRPANTDVVMSIQFSLPPSILSAGGKYYAYTASETIPTAIQVRSSNDLAQWSEEATVFDQAKDVPWRSAPSESAFQPRRVRQPSLLAAHGLFYLYFLDRQSIGDDEESAIGVAISGRPDAQFKEVDGRPLLRFKSRDEVISAPSTFLDDDGQAYLYFTSTRGFYVAPLDQALTGLQRDAVVIRANQSASPGSISVLKHLGLYYFIWPDNSFGGQQGAQSRLCCGTSKSATGPIEADSVTTLLDGWGIVPCEHPTIAEYAAAKDWFIAYQQTEKFFDGSLKYDTFFARLQFKDDGSMVPLKPLSGLHVNRGISGAGGG